MRYLEVKAIGLVAGLFFATGAMADGMTPEQYESKEKSIQAEYKAARSRCESMKGNAEDICEAEAKGNASVAKAELRARYEPSAKNDQNVKNAKAEAAYSVAIERCDGKAGNDKDVCVKEAEAAKVRAMAEAKARLEGTEARKDAAADERKADYAVAKERCDSMAGDSKERCIDDAKARFAQH
jgi:hypothetical protein